MIALIPARGGSKGVPGKNIRPLGGLPLVGWAVRAAFLAGCYDRVVVSTDSAEIAACAAVHGAEVPFLRPAALAGDQSSDRDYVVHALDYFRAEGYELAHIAILRPTTPVRRPEALAEAAAVFLAKPEATGLRSVHELPEPPQKMMGFEKGWLTGLFPQDPRPEYYNLPRQNFPTAYQPNGYVDIVSVAWLTASDAGIYGPLVAGYVTEVVVEVDTPDAFDLLDYQVARRRPALLDLG